MFSTSQDKTQTERGNSDRPLSFWGGKNSDHGLSLGCFWARGRQGGSQNYECNDFGDEGNGQDYSVSTGSGKKKAHKHKSLRPVTL